jgi:hypothetical protein
MIGWLVRGDEVKAYRVAILRGFEMIAYPGAFRAEADIQ